MPERNVPGMSDFPKLSDPTYRIDSKLGAGSGGTVYKAWHTRLEQDVVLKRINDGGLADDFKRVEADILKNLKHAYLPRIYDFLTDPSGVYTVMEYIPGWSFDDLLKTGVRFQQTSVIRWAEQLSSALAYMHSQTPPVLHSDLKPGNVMLTEKEDICLIDFNISLVLTGGVGEAIGRSPGYASPEQYGPISTKTEKTPKRSKNSDETELADLSASSQAGYALRIDARTDIYSFGATLYHLLTGVRPAVSTQPVAPLKTHGKFSKGITYIIEKCMRKNPEERFQTAEELHRAVVDIHKLDSRWKRLYATRVIATLLIVLGFALGATGIGLGSIRLQEERQEKFNLLVQEIRQTGQQSAYEDALALNPENVEPFQAMALFLEEDLEAQAAFIDTVMPSLTAFSYSAEQLRIVGNLQYLRANAYFEEEQYANASDWYKAAAKNVPDSAEIRRDQAVCLARDGYIDAAQKILNELEQDTSVQKESLDLLSGEIAYMQGSYYEATKRFQSVLLTSLDETVRKKCYDIGSRAYRALVFSQDEMDLLRRAVTEYPTNLAFKERLADALVRADRFDEARLLFEDSLLSGKVSFVTSQNIALLYQQTGLLDDAKLAFEKLAADYPSEYRPPMRLAYLELQMQQLKDNAFRDYHAAKEYYLTAQDLYDHRPSSMGEDSDMQALTQAVEELISMGWID
jgi:serine/threonine-protein kinase